MKIKTVLTARDSFNAIGSEQFHEETVYDKVSSQYYVIILYYIILCHTILLLLLIYNVMLLKTFTVHNNAKICKLLD